MESHRKPRPVTRHTARLRKADRKKQIVERAKQLFVAHGYSQTTTEKIAQAVGVTEPVLYRHFPSKKALFLEVLQEIRQATLEHWHSATSTIEQPVEKLRAVVDLYLGSTRSHALELRIMHRTLLETDDADVAAFLRTFYLDSEKLLTRIIVEGQDAGHFRRDFDPRDGAWELIRTALGYTLTAALGIPLYEEADYVPRAIELVMRCLVA